MGSVGKDVTEDIGIPPAGVSGKSPLLLPRQLAWRARFGFETFEQPDCGDIESEARSCPSQIR